MHLQLESMINTESFKWGEWSQWQACSTTCGEGTRKRFRYCYAGNQFSNFVSSFTLIHDFCFWNVGSDGSKCPDDKEIESKPCAEAKCPNYAFHPWSEWSPCTSTCDRGTKSRDRGCIDKNAGSFTVENQKCTHGMDKPELFHQEVDCEVTPCARNGGWTPWPKEWEPCNVHCGEGKNLRQNSNMILFSLVI